MLFSQLKRSPVRWFVPFAVIFSIAMLFLRNRYWMGVWPETSAAAQMPALMVGGLAAAAAAWLVGAPVRHGTVEQASALAVPRWRREVSGAVAVVLYFVAVALVVQVVGFVVTMRTAPPGFALWPGYVVMALTVTCLAIAFGYVVGKLLSGRFAAAVAGLSWFILGMLFGPWVELSTLNGPVYERVDGLIVTVRLLASIALIAVAVMVPPLAGKKGGITSEGAGRIFSLRQSGPALAALVASVVLLVAVIGLGLPIQPRRAPAQALCTGQRMRVCLWPEHKKYERDVAAIVARAERLPAAFVLPPRFDEYGLSYRAVSVNGVKIYDSREDEPPYFYVFEGSMWSIAGSIATQVVAGTLVFCRQAPSTKGPEVDIRASELEKWLEAYLVGGGQPDYHTNASDERQAAWARGRERANSSGFDEQLAWATELIKDFNRAPCR